MSQLRKDIVSGDWIIIAPKRGKRPHQFEKTETKLKVAPLENCPFENPEAQNETVLIYPNKENWRVHIIKNKYPVLDEHVSGECAILKSDGPYALMDATGYHDVVIMRDHEKNVPDIDLEDVLFLFQTIRDRYIMLSTDICIAYISIFQNWGPTAGASIYHPHYQMISLPVIPPDVSHSLLGSARYFEENKFCVHCRIIDWEMRERKRIIHENDRAVAIMPFFSKEPYEVRIFPKRHLPYFENTFEDDFSEIVETVQVVLNKIKNNLNDPDYNLFIHTAPVKNKDVFGHYHWHIEILPKINISAGFELGTGIEINPVDPDEAANTLK